MDTSFLENNFEDLLENMRYQSFCKDAINSWIDEGYDFNDKFLYLSKSMGHTSLESTQYYYSLVPALAEVIRIRTEAGFNEICPEVPRYE